MKIEEIKQKPESELKENLIKKREELRQLRFELTAGKVKGIKGIRETKKDIARILTVLRNTKLATKYEKSTNIRKPVSN